MMATGERALSTLLLLPLTVHCDLPPLTVHFFYHRSQFIFTTSHFVIYHPSQFILFTTPHSSLFLPPLTVHFFYHPSQFVIYHPSQSIFLPPLTVHFYHPSQFVIYHPSQFIFSTTPHSSFFTTPHSSFFTIPHSLLFYQLSRSTRVHTLQSASELSSNWVGELVGSKFACGLFQ